MTTCGAVLVKMLEAYGYARMTGKPAVCFTVSGPGALNIATAMGQAVGDEL